jgi:hypothetical protein
MKTTLLLLFLLITACAKSKNYDPRDFSGRFEIAVDDKNAVTCIGRVYENTQGWPNPIELSGSDKLVCNGTGMENQKTNDTTYQVVQEYKPGDVYKIEFFRKGEKYYSGSVVLPEKVQILNPIADSTYKTGNILTISWTSSQPDSGIQTEVLGGYTYCSKSGMDLGSVDCDLIPAVAGNLPVSQTLRVTRKVDGNSTGFAAKISATTLSTVVYNIEN